MSLKSKTQLTYDPPPPPTVERMPSKGHFIEIWSEQHKVLMRCHIIKVINKSQTVTVTNQLSNQRVEYNLNHECWRLVDTTGLYATDWVFPGHTLTILGTPVRSTSTTRRQSSSPTRKFNRASRSTSSSRSYSVGRNRASRKSPLSDSDDEKGDSYTHTSTPDTPSRNTRSGRSVQFKE